MGTKAGERPDQSHTKARQQKNAPVKGAAANMSDRKIQIIQNAMVAIAVLSGLTQSGIARAIGAGMGSLFNYPQLEGMIDATIFWAPYLCCCFVYLMLSFMKTK